MAKTNVVIHNITPPKPDPKDIPPTPFYRDRDLAIAGVVIASLTFLTIFFYNRIGSPWAIGSDGVQKFLSLTIYNIMFLPIPIIPYLIFTMIVARYNHDDEILVNAIPKSFILFLSAALSIFFWAIIPFLIALAIVIGVCILIGRTS